MVDNLRGSPMVVGTIEEIIDDEHAIVSTAMGPEYYVSIMSFVDKDQLEPGCSVFLHNKVQLTSSFVFNVLYFLRIILLLGCYLKILTQW